MTIYPELMLEMAHDRQRTLVAEAEQGRLLRSARLWARADRAAAKGRVTPAAGARSSQRPAAATVVGVARDGNVAPCGPRAVAPAGR